MVAKSNIVLNQALELTASERVDVVEKLLYSLDKPDSLVDEVWAREADARVEAFERGELKTTSAKSVFGKYRK